MLTLPSPQSILRIFIFLLAIAQFFLIDSMSLSQFIVCITGLLIGIQSLTRHWLNINTLTFLWMGLQIVVLHGFKVEWDANQLFALRWYTQVEVWGIQLGINWTFVALLIVYTIWIKKGLIGKRVDIKPMNEELKLLNLKGVITEIVPIENENWIKVQLDESGIKGSSYTFSALLIQLKEGERLRWKKTANASVRTLTRESNEYRFLDWGKVRFVA